MTITPGTPTTGPTPWSQSAEAVTNGPVPDDVATGRQVMPARTSGSRSPWNRPVPPR